MVGSRVGMQGPGADARAAGWRHAAVERCVEWASRGGAASGSGERGHELQEIGNRGEGILGAQMVFVFLAGGCSTAANCQRAVEGLRLSTAGLTLIGFRARSGAGASF